MSRVYKRGRMWHMEAADSRGRIIVTDTCRVWRTMYDEALLAAFVIREVEFWGNRFELTYAEAVEEARDAL